MDRPDPMVEAIRASFVAGLEEAICARSSNDITGAVTRAIRDGGIRASTNPFETALRGRPSGVSTEGSSYSIKIRQASSAQQTDATRRTKLSPEQKRDKKEKRKAAKKARQRNRR